MVLFVFRAPLLHCLNDRPHGLAQIAQRVFHPRRNLRINRARDDAVFLHGAQAVRQHLLADPVQIPPQLVKAPGPLEQIPHNQQLSLAPDELHGRRNRAGRHFVFRAHIVSPFP